MDRKSQKTAPLDLPRLRGLEQMENAPKARSVALDRSGRTLKIELINDVVLMVPTRLVQILNGAETEQIRDVEILLDGMYLRWPQLDEDLRVQSLIEGTFGTAKWMKGLRQHLTELGRKGGQSKSPAKSDASRINGAKGGRPRKAVKDRA